MDDRDKSTHKLREMQHEIRKNALDTQNYLADLSVWEKEMRQKDAQLLANSSQTAQERYPVRSTPASAGKPTLKKCRKKKKAPRNAIKTSDYSSWDKFDADKACEEVNRSDESEDNERCGSECECDRLDKTNEEIEHEARVKRAELEKSKGNDLFEKGKYEDACDCYSLSISFDKSNPVYYANRGMAALKLKRYNDVERDCTKALSLHPTYTKAFHRRAVARLALKNIPGAREDYQKLLSLEPTNKDAKEKLAVFQEFEEKQKLAKSGQQAANPVAVNGTERKQLILPQDMSSAKKAEFEKEERNDKAQVRVYPLSAPLSPLTNVPLRKVHITASKASAECSTGTPAENVGLGQNKGVKLSTTQIASERSSLPTTLTEPNLAKDMSGERDGARGTANGSFPQLSTDSPRSFAESCLLLYQKSCDDCAQYIQKISPKSYGKLIGQNLSREVVYTVLEGAMTMPDSWAGLEHLKALSQVPRFSFFVHTFTPDQKSALTSMLTRLSALAPDKSFGEVVRAVAASFLVTM